MRKPNILQILCFLLLFAVIPGAVGATKTSSGTGCPGPCDPPPVPGPPSTAVDNAALNGNYAFSFSGLTGNGGVSSVYASAGRFTADGAGNLTNGELDTNTVAGGGAAQSFTGTYSIGNDNRGVMTLNLSSSSAKLAFAMLANGNAQFIEFDASGGAGTIGSGTMEKADTTAYSTARITRDYAFGPAGFANTYKLAANAGRFSSTGNRALAKAPGDANSYGSDYPMS